MKVFYITMLFPAKTETFACNDVLALKNLGVDISVHSLRERSRESEEMEKDRNLDSLHLTYDSKINTIKGFFNSIIYPSISMPLAIWILRHTFNKPRHLAKSFRVFPRTMQLFKGIEKENPDVVHLFWGHYPSMTGYLINRKLSRNVLSFSLGAYDLGMRYGGSRDIIKKADLVTTFAEVNVKDLVELGADPEKIKVVYRGIEYEKYDGWTRGISRTERKIVTVGRLIREKGMRGALMVFSGISKKYPDSKLVVLGDGPMMEELQKLSVSLRIEKNVSFRGHVSHSDVLRELKSAEVFLFMSGYKNERLPNAVKEALFCGCFTVASETPGIYELIPDNRYGFIVKPGDVDAAFKIIDEFFMKPDRVKSVSEYARGHVINNFDTKNEMKKLKQSWEEILEKKN